jgi:hypothetical protein
MAKDALLSTTTGGGAKVDAVDVKEESGSEGISGCSTVVAYVRG